MSDRSLDEWTLADEIANSRTGTSTILSGFIARVMLVHDLAAELGEAHAAGLVHGGISPDCVRLDARGSAHLVGWRDRDQNGPLAHAVAYRAPEADAAHTVTGDMYAMGAVLWELLTLRPPLVVEENMTRFWRRKRAGEVDPLPAATTAAVPPDLLAIAKRALEVDPALRWQQAEEMQTALKGWLDRVESVVVTMQAEGALAALPGNDGDAGHVAEGFRSALALWPGNRMAQEGLSAAASVQSLAAIEDGDEDTAVRHAGQTSGIAEAVVQAELRHMRQRKRRGRWLRLVLMVTVPLALAVGAWMWWSQQRLAATWLVEAEWRLAKGARTTGLEVSTRSVDAVAPLPVPDEDGVLLPAGKIVWLKDVDCRGDVRFGIEALWTDQVDGVELMLGVPRLPPPAFAMAQPGYTSQFGGFRGTQTFLSASSVAGWPRRLSPVSVPYLPQRRYRMELERQGETLRMRVDGDQVWEQRELIPVGDNRYRWLGLRAWAPLRVHRIYVEKPAARPGADQLGTADALARGGHHADALTLYQGVIEADADPDTSAQALAKAHLLAARLPGHDLLRKQLCRQAERAIAADSPYMRDILDAEALALWQAREWAPALNLAGRLQKRHPGDACAMSLLERRLADVPEASMAVLLRLVAEGPPVSHLDLSGLGLSDISAIAGMRIESLDIANNRIADLRPLAGMRLQLLTCSYNRISDLAPLRGMPLLRLEARSNRIADLSPLAGTALEQVDLSFNCVIDLAPIAVPGLRSLVLAGNPLSDLRPLSACGHLSALNLNGCRVVDLTAVPLSALVRLDLAGCPLSDLGPLASAHRLTSLDLSGTSVADVHALPRHGLRAVKLAGTPLESLAGLAGIDLGLLDLSDTHLTSLSGLERIALHAGGILILDRTAIDSIEPLAGTTLNRLSINGTRVRDLSPLAGSSLRHLQADGVPATDVTPIASIAGLRRISLWNIGARSEDLDRLADAFDLEHRDRLLVETMRTQAAARAGDWRRLRAMGRRYGARDRLILGVELTLGEARAVAAAAGAHLPCPIDLDDLRDLGAHQAMEYWFWLGLRGGAEGSPLMGDDGRPASQLAWLRQPADGGVPASAWIAPNSPAEANLLPVDEAALPVRRGGVVLEW